MFEIIAYSNFTGWHLYCSYSDHQGITHRLYQAHLASEHCIFRLGRGCLSHHAGHHEWQQCQHWNLRKAHAHHPGHIDFRFRLHHSFHRAMEANLDHNHNSAQYSDWRRYLLILCPQNRGAPTCSILQSRRSCGRSLFNYTNCSCVLAEPSAFSQV